MSRLQQATRRHPIAVAWVIVAAILLAGTVWALPRGTRYLPEPGMRASLFAGTTADTPPQFTGIDTTLDPVVVMTTHGGDASRPFVVEWQGLLVVTERGTHHLRARADDGVAVWVEDVPVIDTRGHVGEQQVSVPVSLEPGLRRLRVLYVQAGGDAVLRVSWTRPSSRETFAALRTVVDADGPAAFARIVAADRRPYHVASAWSIWIVCGLLLLLSRIVSLAAGIPRILSVLDLRHVIVLAAVAAPLLLANVEMGAQPWRSWAPDEIHPSHVLDAWASGFSNGWFHLYPPLPFYVLTLVNAPFLVLGHWSVIGLSEPAAQTAMHVIDRGMSAGFAWMTLLATALLADRAVGGRGRVLAPYVLLGVPLFAFYAKTTNVDMGYTFWFAAAALAFVEAATERRLRDHVVLGACVACAVATKDQAYGLFTGAAAALLWVTWRESGGGVAGSLRTMADRRLWLGALICFVVYGLLVGVWWNQEGVLRHIDLITGPGSVPFRMFQASPRGFERLAATTVSLTVQAIGPLVTLAVLAGVMTIALSGASARVIGLLAALLGGYLLTFVAVVGYVYDRFLLGVLVILAIVAARGLDWLLDRCDGTRLRRAAAVVMVAVLLAPAVRLNLLLAGDSRRRAEAWLDASIVDDPLVLGAGSPIYLPNLSPFQHRIERRTSTDNLLAWDADVIVMYDDWFGRPGQPTLATVRRALEEAGYTRRFTAAPAEPPAPWRLGLFSGLHIDSVFSNIGKIDPPLSIWQRD